MLMRIGCLRIIRISGGGGLIWCGGVHIWMGWTGVDLHGFLFLMMDARMHGLVALRKLL